MAREGLRLGRVDGEGPDLFGDIGAIQADSEGHVYVLEYQTQELRIFDEEGGHVRTFGRRGQGPGEWAGAAGITFDEEGDLWIWDPNNRRFSSFDRTGTLLAETPRLIAGVLFPWPGGFDRREGLLDFGLDRPGDGPNQVGSLSIVYPIAVDAVDGTPDTLPSLDREYVFVEDRLRLPFQGLLTTAMDYEGGLWFAHTERYEILKRDLRGDTLFGLRRADAVPRPVTEADRDSLVAAWNELPPGFPRLDPDDLPVTRPVIDRMLTDGAGHLLVMVDLDGRGPGTTVDVFDQADGRFLGSVQLSVDLLRNPRPVATPGHLYGVVLDELEVQHVVRIDFAPAGS